MEDPIDEDYPMMDIQNSSSAVEALTGSTADNPALIAESSTSVKIQSGVGQRSDMGKKKNNGKKEGDSKERLIPDNPSVDYEAESSSSSSDSLFIPVRRKRKSAADKGKTRVLTDSSTKVTRRRPPTITEDGEVEYHVEKVLKKQTRGKIAYYLIKWEGYDDKDNTWEPITNLEGCMSLVKEYEKKKVLLNEALLQQFLGPTFRCVWRDHEVPIYILGTSEIHGDKLYLVRIKASEDEDVEAVKADPYEGLSDDNTVMILTEEMNKRFPFLVLDHFERNTTFVNAVDTGEDVCAKAARMLLAHHSRTKDIPVNQSKLFEDMMPSTSAAAKSRDATASSHESGENQGISHQSAKEKSLESVKMDVCGGICRQQVDGPPSGSSANNVPARDLDAFGLPESMSSSSSDSDEDSDSVEVIKDWKTDRGWTKTKESTERKSKGNEAATEEDSDSKTKRVQLKEELISDDGDDPVANSSGV